jgi:hypothetical protein
MFCNNSGYRTGPWYATLLMNTENVGSTCSCGFKIKSRINKGGALYQAMRDLYIFSMFIQSVWKFKATSSTTRFLAEY